MRRQSFYTVILSLLLICLGFFLGQYYALMRGKIWQAGKFVAVSNNLANRILLEAEGRKLFPLQEEKPFIQEINETRQEDNDLQFPSRVGTLYIDKIISGKEALALSQKIFGSDAPVKRLFIPYYSNSENQAVVWVFEMNSHADALQYTEKINQHLEESKALRHGGSFFIHNVEVHYVKGLNYDNYYYCKNNFIYWISLQAIDPTTVFLTFYEYF